MRKRNVPGDGEREDEDPFVIAKTRFDQMESRQSRPRGVGLGYDCACQSTRLARIG